MAKEAKETIDTKVAKLMAEVKKRRADVEVLKKPQWTTSCSLVLPGFERINIQVCTDLTLLALAIGAINRMQEDVSNAVAALDVEIPWSWQNYPFVDWTKDIRLRIKVTQILAEQKKLKALEKRLQPLLSDDQRRELELAEIEAELN